MKQTLKLLVFSFVLMVVIMPFSVQAEDYLECPELPIIPDHNYYFIANINLDIRGDLVKRIKIIGGHIRQNYTLKEYGIEAQIPVDAYNWYSDESLQISIDPDTFHVVDLEDIYVFSPRPLYTVSKTNYTPHGTLSNGIKWSVSGDTLTLSPSNQGMGDMVCDHYEGKYPWNIYASAIKKVVLNNGITSISEKAFSALSSITSVSLPGTLKKIGVSAFSGCNQLQSLALPSSLQSIGDSAFSDCSRLQSISLPSSLRELGGAAFAGTGIKRVSVPNSVTRIPGSCFASCTSLTSIELPSSLIEIAGYAFYNTPISSVTLPSDLQLLGLSCFENCSSLTSVSIPSKVTTISSRAFAGCTSLRTVTIPASVTTMYSAFQGCTSLQAINVDPQNTVFASQDGVLFNKSMERLLQFPLGLSKNSYTIPYGVTSIKANPYSSAFSECEGLKKVIVPGTVKTIEPYTFWGCTNLEAVELSYGVNQIQEYAFDGCSNLQTVQLPTSIKAISECAFYRSGIQSITIPDSVTSIGWGAFNFCSRLRSIEIPKSVGSMEGEIFGYCSSLESVIIKGLNGKISDSMFSRCTNLKTLYLPKTITGIEANAFANCSALTDVYFEGTQAQWNTVIANSASDSVSALSSATIHYGYALNNNQVSVVLDSNGGTLEQDTITVTVGQKYGTLPSPTRGNHTFNGWYTSAEGGSKVTASTTVTNNAPHTLYAHWTYVTPTYTITFDPNGGEVSLTSKTVLFGEPYGELPTPTRENYTFLGWFTAKVDGAQVTNLTVVDLTKNQTLYALWKPNIYPPRVETNDPSGVSKTQATLKGYRIENGNATCSYSFVYWSKYSAASKYTANASLRDDGSFDAEIGNLSPDTEYYYYAKAVNSAGEGTGNTVSFRTKPEDTPQSIVIMPSKLSMQPGEKSQLLAGVLPETASNRNVVWGSSDPTVVQVDQQGKLTAIKEGSTTITATTEVNQLKATCKVTVKNQTISGKFDFSEWNMVMNTRAGAVDGTDIINNEQYKTGYGGDYQIATSYLARWDGAVLEENDPYPTYNGKYKEVDSDYHVQDVVWIAGRKSYMDNDDIKTAVMRYGAVYIDFAVNWDYFDSKTWKTYYYPENGTRIDGYHAVAVVGWDDNYSASNFKVTPPGNGAFICKNSWGKNSGYQGYLYISYYDKYLGEAGCSAVTSLETNSNYNKIYQYDPLGVSTYWRVTYGANIFPRHGATLQKNEILRAVSFYTVDKNTAYEVSVVPNYESPYSLRKRITVATGVMEEAGYHTVQTDQAIDLQAGTRFGIVVKLSNPNTIYLHAAEAPIGNNSGARANYDESYYSTNGADWVDLTTLSDGKNHNFCIKAFTDNGLASRSSQLFSGIDNDNVDYESDRVYSLEEALAAGLPVNPAYIEWYQKKQIQAKNAEASDNETDDEMALGAEPPFLLLPESEVSFTEGLQLPSSYDLREEGCVTPVRNQGNYGTCWAHAMYASLESYLLKCGKTLSASSSGSMAELSGLVDAMGSSAPESLTLNAETITLSEGDKFRLQASFETAGISDPTVIWTSNAEAVATVNTNGVVTAQAKGSAVITARSSDGSLEAVCQVTVTDEQPVSGVAFHQHSLSKGVGDVFFMDYTVTPSTARNKNVTWHSSASDVVAVNANGLAIALKAGTAKVTVKTEDGSFTDNVTVTVTEDAAHRAMRFPSGLVTIEEAAFEGDSFTIALLGSRVKTIQSRAFAACGSLVYIYVPSSVTSIADNAFAQCSQVMIGCERDSEAYQYAIRNRIKYFIPEP